MNFDKPEEIFRHIIHVIFAVIIAISYETAANIFTELGKENFSIITLVPIFEILLAYIILVSGLVGYTHAMSIKPHTCTSKGITRFILDMIVVFFYFVLIKAINLEGEFNHFFLSYMVVLFALSVLWEEIAFREYKSNRDELKLKDLKNNLLATRLFGQGFLLIIFSTFLIDYFVNDNEIMRVLSYLTILGFLMAFWIFYRFSKRARSQVEENS